MSRHLDPSLYGASSSRKLDPDPHQGDHTEAKFHIYRFTWRTYIEKPEPITLHIFGIIDKKLHGHKADRSYVGILRLTHLKKRDWTAEVLDHSKKYVSIPFEFANAIEKNFDIAHGKDKQSTVNKDEPALPHPLRFESYWQNGDELFAAFGSLRIQHIKNKLAEWGYTLYSPENSPS